MNRLIYILLIGFVFLISCEKEEEGEKEQTVDISMGANQAMDVYYSFTNGEVSSSDRSTWDLAFSVPLQTATIRINEGAGVELYQVGDTNLWESADTSGIQGWDPLYNDKSDWMTGAFNVGSTGGFDYGWAIYDHGNTYNVIGQYIYVIKLSNGAYKKLYIIKKDGRTNTYHLRWANIDGSDQVDETFSPAAYAETKHFIHYSLVTGEMVVTEPDMEAWDLLFTRYMEKIEASPGTEVDYPVMGVLMNQDHEGVQVSGMDSSEAGYSDAETDFLTQADVIGWDWKSFDPETQAITVAADKSYFIKLAGGSIYKLYFTDYAGEAEGSMTFRQLKVE
ncbi:MAG: HmuY family protein [Bacteroidales bacterium]